jgi:hypothetical protein
VHARKPRDAGVTLLLRGKGETRSDLFFRRGRSSRFVAELSAHATALDEAAARTVVLNARSRFAHDERRTAGRGADQEAQGERCRSHGCDERYTMRSVR